MVDGATRRLAAAGQALAHLNPQSVLDRGYAIVTRADGGIVRDASTLAVADEVGLRLARGTARARVTDTDSGSGSPA
jgi:exodeoxyribonuclease VII large subunit